MKLQEFLSALRQIRHHFEWKIVDGLILGFRDGVKYSPITAVASVMCNYTFRITQFMLAGEKIGLSGGIDGLSYRIDMASCHGNLAIRNMLVEALNLK